MEIQKTIGVVLSSRPMGDSDKAVVIFTKKYGKRTFIVKGIRKSKTRSQLISEAGTIVSLIYYYRENKGSCIVNEFTIKKHYSDIRKDYDRILHLYFLLEITEKTTGFADINIDIFKLLISGIEAISKTDFIKHLSFFYLIQLARIHGIFENFDLCKKCGEKQYRQFIIDINDFQPVCINCSDPLPNIAKSRYFDNIHRMFIFDVIRKKFTQIKHLEYSDENVLNLLFYLTMFFEHYFGITIKSKRLIL